MRLPLLVSSSSHCGHSRWSVTSRIASCRGGWVRGCVRRGPLPRLSGTVCKGISTGCRTKPQFLGSRFGGWHTLRGVLGGDRAFVYHSPRCGDDRGIGLVVVGFSLCSLHSTATAATFGSSLSVDGVREGGLGFLPACMPILHRFQSSSIRRRVVHQPDSSFGGTCSNESEQASEKESKTARSEVKRNEAR